MPRPLDPSKFIEVMETVYAILMAAGFLAGWEQFNKHIPQLVASGEISPLYITSCLFGLSCTLILIRFFFAPSKNLPALVIKSEKFAGSVLVFDVPLMLLHSGLFYLICSRFEHFVVNNFYGGFIFFFSALLFVNVFWLLTIKYRLANDVEEYFSTWISNNVVHLVCIIFISVLFKKGYVTTSVTSQGVIILVITISNSVLDLLLTAPAYLSPIKKKNN